MNSPVQKIILVWVVVGIFVGCSQQRDWTAVETPADYKHTQENRLVTVAVEPWTSAQDINTLFKRKPGSDILPIRIVLFNQSKSTIRFSSTQARLMSKGGAEMPRVPNVELVDRLQDNEAGMASIVMMATAGYGQVIAAAFSGAANRDNWSDRTAVKTCSMDLVTLDAGKSMSGFLFFKKPYKRIFAKRDHPMVNLAINRMPRGADEEPLSFDINFPLYGDKTKD